MRRDILTEIYNGYISVDEANNIFQHIITSDEVTSAQELLGMSHQEWTAWCNGVGFDELPRWRHKGWPNICPKCKKRIEIEKYGWLAKKEGKCHVLFHLSCLGLTEIVRRDILTELYKGFISEDDVYAIYDRIMSSPEAGSVRDLLGMNNQEWTAYCYSVGFVELARWRHEGWPDICPKCGQKIDIANYGWMAHKMKGKRHVIYHVSCLAEQDET